jgi:hypothetical protein
MSVERLLQAREELRREFMEYVENLATNNAAEDDVDQLVRLRGAIDALDHAIKGGWDQKLPEPQVPRSQTWREADELPGDERG